MKILITGAKGQVGSELVKEAKKRGHDVYPFGSKELDISIKTIEVHRANLMSKMEADSLSDLIRKTLSAQDEP